jgi:hypothetical protein
MEVRLRAEPRRLPLAGAWVALGLAGWVAAAWIIVRPRAAAAEPQRLEPAADTLRK